MIPGKLNRGYQHDGAWFLRSLKFDLLCPWCGLGKPETLEFLPCIPVEGGAFKVQSLFYFARGDNETVAIASHLGCGPDWLYWVDIDRVRKDPDGWIRHLSQKRWYDYTIESAIKAASRTVPVVTVNRDRSTKTYLIQSEFGGHVKIGKSSNPEARLRSLQTGRADRLILRKVFNENCESELHQRFAGLREAGEWFRCEGELALMVEQ